MPCVSNGPVIICYSGKQECIRRDLQGERWCFRCRKRREFFFEIWRDIDPESYYGPNPSIVCGTCGLSDGDLFPGYSREWED